MDFVVSSSPFHFDYILYFSHLLGIKELDLFKKDEIFILDYMYFCGDAPSDPWRSFCPFQNHDAES